MAGFFRPESSVTLLSRLKVTLLSPLMFVECLLDDQRAVKIREIELGAEPMKNELFRKGRLTLRNIIV